MGCMKLATIHDSCDFVHDTRVLKSSGTEQPPFLVKVVGFALLEYLRTANCCYRKCYEQVRY